ncbi:hypothetical protein N7492_009422 [Penicillium capsulatum]|uniref:Uncharacterized protein n=1 Tax=Penicillium capsulatum TaxID=69766 RepID=A0A9W9HX32_9EURO|nr:hypothetical protein N7492_009422 [Penicillium capsulatum]
MEGALPASETCQPQVTAVDPPTTSPDKEIPTRSERGSPGPNPDLDASPPSTSLLLSPDFSLTQPASARSGSAGSEAATNTPAAKKVYKRSRRKAGRKKGMRRLSRDGQNDQRMGSAPGPDNSQQALSPDEESQSRQRDVDTQSTAVTDASSAQSQTSTLAAPVPSVPASTGRVAMSDMAPQDSGIAVPAAAFPSTGLIKPSDASAEDHPVDMDTETRTSTPPQGESLSFRSAEAQAVSSVPVTASQARHGHSSPIGTTATRMPGTRRTVAVTVGATRGAPLRAAHPHEPADAGDAPLSQMRGFAPPATASFTPGAQNSRQHTATPAVGAVATRRRGTPISSGHVSPTTLNSGAMTAPTPASTPVSQGKFQRVEKPTDGGFFYDLTYHSFECAKSGCDKRCTLWDGCSVICPRCGPYSRVRYCGKEHLREDLKQHWSLCGQEQSFKHWCVPTSLPPDVLAGPPMLPCIHGWDSPERQRQAVWFSNGRREGDYFLFSDWNDQFKNGAVPGSMETRCSPCVARVVKYADPDEKDRFRRVLAVCLFASLEHPKLVGYLFRMIRDNLLAQDQWNAQVDVMLRHQFKYEMGVTLRPSITGERHACRIEWTGQSRRHCQDPTCVSENPPVLLGHLAQLGFGFDRLCAGMESEFWILRASRTTHPACQRIEARIRGEGYGDDVAVEDRRAFRRGEGWDGAGSGPMEIEGLDWRALAGPNG